MTLLSDTVAPKIPKKRGPKPLVRSNPNLCICNDPECAIPYGCCHCGCGKKTKIAIRTHRTHGHFGGWPRKYVFRHRGVPRIDFSDAAPFKIDGEYCLLIDLLFGWFAIVDIDRHSEIKNYNWFGDWKPSSGMYARRWAVVNGKYIGVMMHDQIKGKRDGKTVDHGNGNTLDNRDSNLRFASPRQQMQNKKKGKGSYKSIYKGIRFGPNGEIFGFIYPAKKQVYLGTFKSEVNAAVAYDRAALYYYGEFARLNFPRSDYDDSPSQ